MKRYLTIAIVLAILLFVAFAGGALAQREGLTLRSLAEALATHTERINVNQDRIDALEQRLLTVERFATPLDLKGALAAAYGLAQNDVEYNGGHWEALTRERQNDLAQMYVEILIATARSCNNDVVRARASAIDSFAVWVEDEGITTQSLGWGDDSTNDFRMLGMMVLIGGREEEMCYMELRRVAREWLAEHEANQP